MNYREINSAQNEHIKLLAKLKEKKYRKEFNLALIEGWNIIDEALQHNLVVEILTTKINQRKLKNFNNILLTIVSESILTKLSQSKNSQNIIGVIDLTKVKEQNNFQFNQNILLLENIQDPGNVGTLIRTGLGFGFTNIILYNHTVDLFNDKVLRASQGAIFKVAIKEANLIEIKNFQLNRYKIITTGLKRQSVFLQDCHCQFKQNERYILALGNEGHGLSTTLQEISDYNVQIKINSQLESLNVAQAGTILMYEINRQMEEK
ncbi:TrmH family RNA methyltransferase [Spiroplasma citri]|uniref:Putative rrna methyl transferase protein n=1 Tax=Spiroplasma citri TaxID=2133 RepID=Q6XK16_SPICI|nr:RNA methyltransferase [Spiroplasma citri]AAP55640.1 rRNA methylase [Spiroplasma citri]APE74367.1 rRNA methylase [Spiroplasma citri]QED24315.1 RNA methyltransferase [Spiroplasma citri]QIA66583.1 RNA methyltransferase [Spiroplasma citri]QIA68463.1 RNA methyltransferase [Spiroplasma citri]